MKREGLVERLAARRAARGTPVRPVLQPLGQAPALQTAPTNITPETAIAISLPYALDIVETAVVVTETLYYTYLAGAGDQVIKFSALSPHAEVYSPLLEVLIGPPSALTPYLSLASIFAAFQVPVTPGTTYTFAVSNAGGATPPSVVQIRAEAGPRLASPIGALVIPDDTDGFPATILSPETGEVLRTQSLPAGERGEMLPDGTSIWHDEAGNLVELWHNGFVDPVVVTWDSARTPVVTSNRDDRFYLGDPGGGGTLASLHWVNASGDPGDTVWTLSTSGLTDMVVSRDDTIMYFVRPPTLTTPIRRWDLVANSALSDLAAGVSGYYTFDLLSLPDGSILAGYLGSSDSLVRRYAANGTVLHTYALGAVDFNHMTYATDETSFWVWSYPHDLDGYSRFTHLQVADGAVIQTFDVVQYNSGLYAGTTPEAGGFGHSFSCPFTTVPFPLGEPEAPGVSYHLVEHPIRRLRRAPHVAQEHTRIFYRRFELDLERGQALASGQGSEPQVLLRISRDGGQTWGEEQRLAVGGLGDYTARVIARRLGHARDTVFEVVVSDPVAWSLVGAWLDVEPGTS